MTTQRQPRSIWLKAAVAAGVIIIAMAALHLTINSDLGAWIRSIHG